MSAPISANTLMPTPKPSSFHSPDEGEAFALLRISWSMSAPVLLGYAEGGDYTERKKDRTQNNVTPLQAKPAQKSDGR